LHVGVGVGGVTVILPSLQVTATAQEGHQSLSQRVIMLKKRMHISEVQ
jgi:hypothetical protein